MRFPQMAMCTVSWMEARGNSYNFLINYVKLSWQGLWMKNAYSLLSHSCLLGCYETCPWLSRVGPVIMRLDVDYVYMIILGKYLKIDSETLHTIQL